MTHEPGEPNEARSIVPSALETPSFNHAEAEKFAARIPDRIPQFGAIDPPAQTSPAPNSLRVLRVDRKAVAGGAVLLDCALEKEPSSKHSSVTISGGDVNAVKIAAPREARALPARLETRFWRVLTPDKDWESLFQPPPQFQSTGISYDTPNPLAERISESREYAAAPSIIGDASPGTVIWFGGIGPSWKLEIECQHAFIREGFAFIGSLESVLTGYARLRVKLEDLPDDPKERLSLMFASMWEGIKQGLTMVSVYPKATAAGTGLGKSISKSVTTCATGAEPILAWLEQVQPALKTKPLIVVGCSGGVPAAMAFASRHVDRLAGLIIIGGFEDFEQLFKRTDLNGGEPTVAWRTDTPLPEQQRDFTESFRANCTVDPGTLARSIPTDRALMIQGRFDTLVPADLSDRLWESLGRPERWKFFGGHRLLFWRLSAYSDDLANWAENQAQTQYKVR